MTYDIMRASRILIAACAMVILTGCQATERFRDNVTRRLQSAAVCSLLSITASPDSAGDDPAAAPAPVQVKRAKRSAEPTSPAPVRTVRREAPRTIASILPAESELSPLFQIVTIDPAVERSKVEVLRTKQLEKRMEKLMETSVRRQLIVRKNSLPRPAIAPVEAVIEVLPREDTPLPQPCTKSRHQESVPVIVPVAETIGGPGSSCFPGASFACADAAPQR